MNDRFEFRCYNKFQEKMFYVKSMSYINGIVQRIEVQDDDRILIFDEWQNNIDNTVLMQSTGLKDKNGKLIFEADIVKDDHGAWHYVKWVYNGWQLFPCTQNNYTIGIVDDEIEVIGNIYENKDLLNA